MKSEPGWETAKQAKDRIACRTAKAKYQADWEGQKTSRIW